MSEKQNNSKQTKGSKKKMTDKPVKAKAAQIQLPPKCRFTKTSLEIYDSISYEEFIEIGDFLLKARGSILWWAGDYLKFDEDKEREMDNSKVREILDSLYAEGTLDNAAYVARSIEPSRRRESLSFSHRQEVAPLPVDEQEYWLNKAEEKKYSIRVLRMFLSRIRFEEERKKISENADIVYWSSYRGKMKFYSYEDYLNLCTKFVDRLNFHIFNLRCSKEKFDPSSYKEPPEEKNFIKSIKSLIQKIKRLDQTYKKYKQAQGESQAEAAEKNE